MCIYVYIHVCFDACVFVFLYTYVCWVIRTNKYIDIVMYIHKHVYIYIFKYVYVYIYLYQYVFLHVRSNKRIKEVVILPKQRSTLLMCL